MATSAQPFLGHKNLACSKALFMHNAIIQNGSQRCLPIEKKHAETMLHQVANAILR